MDFFPDNLRNTYPPINIAIGLAIYSKTKSSRSITPFDSISPIFMFYNQDSNEKEMLKSIIVKELIKQLGEKDRSPHSG